MLKWIWKVNFCNVKYFPLKLDIQYKKAWFYPSKTRGQKSTRPSELETAHSHNETECRTRVSDPRHETETQDMSAGIQTSRSNTKQGKHAHVKTGHDGSVRALSQNP